MSEEPQSRPFGNRMPCAAGVRPDRIALQGRNGLSDRSCLVAQCLLPPPNEMTTSDLASDNRVDFQLRRGEILGYLGPNGSGNLTTAS